MRYVNPFTTRAFDEMHVDTKKHSEYWLLRWSTLERKICTFTEGALLDFITYEAFTRQREKVIKRLMSRYYKLCRTRVTKDLLLVMNNTKPAPVVDLSSRWENTNERESDREVPMSES